MSCLGKKSGQMTLLLIAMVRRYVRECVCMLRDKNLYIMYIALFLYVTCTSRLGFCCNTVPGVHIKKSHFSPFISKHQASKPCTGVQNQSCNCFNYILGVLATCIRN